MTDAGRKPPHIDTEKRAMHSARRIIGITVLFAIPAALCCRGVRAQDAAVSATDESEPRFQGLGIDDWLERLSDQGRNADERVTAAFALKHLTGKTLRLRGFSDVPFDKEPPAELTNEQLRTIVAGLVTALHDREPKVRAAAASTVEAIGSSAVDAVPTLTRLLDDADADVQVRAVIALGAIGPEAQPAVPALKKLLRSKDWGLLYHVTESLGAMGSRAKDAVPELVDVMRNGPDDSRTFAAFALRDIGVDETTAESLAGLWTEDNEYIAPTLFETLWPFPDAALEFLRHNPEAIANVNNHMGLAELAASTEERNRDLRQAVLDSDDLPLPAMALIGERRFLQVIERRMEVADAYQKLQLAAAARACGALPGRVVKMAPGESGGFAPTSAWPGVNEKRKTASRRHVDEATGAITFTSSHSDGWTDVIITGKLLREDGSPVVNPRLFRQNDGMLLGERTDDETPVKYDPETARFVLVTSVFSAYSSGENQEEPGPYQTGSAIFRLESERTHPLEVRFFDEMPDVEIRLAPPPF
jgi:hypothetical protein